MDVLRPPLVYIGNRCYRKNPVSSTTNTAEDDYEDDELGYRDDEYADESCALDVVEDIRSTAAGYQLNVQLPSVFFKYIIGKKGETKKRLESETRTQIRIPRQHEEGDIVILGSDRAGVISARTRIEVLTTSARRHLPFTHFLSLPIVSDAVREKFDIFKEEVLQECAGERGIDGSMFQNRFKLHMTLGTMVLLDDSEIARASALLQECQQDLVRMVLKNEPMTVCVRGLEYMNDDPSAVDVLYAKVSLTDDSNRLPTFADRLIDRFVASGIMLREYDHVKLHITIMNSLMRKDPSHTIVSQNDRASTRSSMKDRESFDAMRLMQMFNDYEFGEQHLDTIHISQRHSVSADSYYQAAASVSLP